MLNIFKSKAQRNADKLIAQAPVHTVLAAHLMTLAKYPHVATNKKFVKEFTATQKAWFEYYSSASARFDAEFDLTDNNNKLVCTAMAVVLTTIQENSYDLEKDKFVNIMKIEANLNNVPRVYADAFIKFFETASA